MSQVSISVEHPNVVHPQKSTLKNVVAIVIFFIHPPGKIEQQLVEHFFKEGAVGFALYFRVDFIYTPRCPTVNWRVDIAKVPLVGW